MLSVLPVFEYHSSLTLGERWNLQPNINYFWLQRRFGSKLEPIFFGHIGQSSSSKIVLVTKHASLRSPRLFSKASPGTLTTDTATARAVSSPIRMTLPLQSSGEARRRHVLSTAVNTDVSIGATWEQLRKLSEANDVKAYWLHRKTHFLGARVPF